MIDYSYLFRINKKQLQIKYKSLCIELILTGHKHSHLTRYLLILWTSSLITTNSQYTPLNRWMGPPLCQHLPVVLAQLGLVHTLQGFQQVTLDHSNRVLILEVVFDVLLVFKSEERDGYLLDSFLDKHNFKVLFSFYDDIDDLQGLFSVSDMIFVIFKLILINFLMFLNKLCIVFIHDISE